MDEFKAPGMSVRQKKKVMVEMMTVMALMVYAVTIALGMTEPAFCTSSDMCAAASEPANASENGSEHQRLRYGLPERSLQTKLCTTIRLKPIEDQPALFVKVPNTSPAVTFSPRAQSTVKKHVKLRAVKRAANPSIFGINLAKEVLTSVPMTVKRRIKRKP